VIGRPTGDVPNASWSVLPSFTSTTIISFTFRLPLFAVAHPSSYAYLSGRVVVHVTQHTVRAARADCLAV
jgi:hypothetical protein